MLRKIRLFSANFLFWLSAAPNTIKFLLASMAPGRAQRKILFKILKDNQETIYGKTHGFAGIKTIKKFQSSVPVNTYEDFLPSIKLSADGQENILTRNPVILFEPTSGSSSSSKLIPYTSGLSKDFRNGLDPWICFLYLRHLSLFFGSVYWSITPSQHEKKFTAGGIPIGFAEDGEYFGKIQRWVLDTIGAVPNEVKHLQDLDAFRFRTLLFLVARQDLRLMSIWNPTYLSLLLGKLEETLPSIINELEEMALCDHRRLQELKNILENRSEKTLYEEIWPNLKLISCWCDGASANQVGEIIKMFPQVKIQPKGLLATEAIISFPFFGKHSVPAIRSHFLEFQELQSEEIFLAHELKTGIRYKIIVTTSGGLYRYALGDIVECAGFFGKLPTLRFIGRGDKIVDLVGEKLNEHFVEREIGKALDALGLNQNFWMLAPQKASQNSYRYVLFLEAEKKQTEELTTISAMIESALAQNYHYQYARKLGQLEPATTFKISVVSPSTVYLEACAALGQQLGAIKPAKLHRYEYWADKFLGAYIQ